MNTDFSGIWRADLVKSRLLGPLPKAIVTKIDHNGSELAVEITVTKANGNRNRTSFRCLTTGEVTVNSIQGAQLRSRSLWVGKELLIESWMRAGGSESHFRDYWSLSPDAKILTMEHRDDDLACQITLLERIHVAGGGFPPETDEFHR